LQKAYQKTNVLNIRLLFSFICANIMSMELERRIKILTEGAKYDVSCSSSGSDRKNSAPGGLGNAAMAGICHSFASDGRCISLLKMLLSNDCVYDCLYCVNRRSNDVARACLTPRELCDLAIGFYKRNYIEGLFLSSAIAISPNNTMQLLFETVYLLRTEYKFNGYVHLKGIPGADYGLIRQASLLADRMSFNIEMPTNDSLRLLAPQKTKEAILEPMKKLSVSLIEREYEKPYLNKKIYGGYGNKINGGMATDGAPADGAPFYADNPADGAFLEARPERIQKYAAALNPAPKPGLARYNNVSFHGDFARERALPAGQTTQMIVGATGDSDGTIIRLSEGLYNLYKLKRVYYSGYVPVGSSDLLPRAPVNLIRENRLYQADWLLRFYGFGADELIEKEENLSLDIDPKTAWALKNMHRFPIEINKAEFSELLRVPGIGVRSALKIIKARRTATLSYADLLKMRVVLKRARHFITCGGRFDGYNADSGILKDILALPAAKQLSAMQINMFEKKEISVSVLSGEL
jgi:putative DNA modification/repair radical SAM protein